MDFICSFLLFRLLPSRTALIHGPGRLPVNPRRCSLESQKFVTTTSQNGNVVMHKITTKQGAHAKGRRALPEEVRTNIQKQSSRKRREENQLTLAGCLAWRCWNDGPGESLKISWPSCS